MPDPTDPASHYDRVTAAWTLLLGDDLHYGLFATGDEPLAEATAALTARMAVAAGFGDGGDGGDGGPLDVLDVGCGTGAPACALAATYGVRVHGISTSSVGVAAAQARAGAAGLAGSARFSVADGTASGLPDDSFDVVWVLESSHLMPDRAALVRECARVLRPGGRLALCDIVRRRDLPVLEVRRLLSSFTLLREVFGDARMDPLDHYVALATGAGLVVDAAEDLTAATRPTFARWCENAERHRDAVDAALGADGRRRFVEACAVLEGFWDDGTLGYGLVAAHRPA